MTDTKFKKGQSGNPKGKPPGAGKVAKLRAEIAKDVPDIIKKLVEQAKAGDAQSARLLLERVVPPLKATEETAALSMPDGSLTEQGRAVLAAVAGGDLAPGQGAALLASLGHLAKLVETDELARRIAALEESNAKR